MGAAGEDFAGSGGEYRYAKLIIKLINDVAEGFTMIPPSRQAQGRFLADYNVSLRDHAFPPRSSEADFHRAWKPPDRQHEARAQRRADHRHAGRAPISRSATMSGLENIAIFGMEAMDVVVPPQAGARRHRCHHALAASGARDAAIGSARSRPTSPPLRNRVAHALRHLDHYMVSADFDAYYEGPARHRRALAGVRPGPGQHMNVARCRGSRRTHHPGICRRFSERSGEATARLSAPRQAKG